jgi:hypothetical protein
MEHACPLGAGLVNENVVAAVNVLSKTLPLAMLSDSAPVAAASTTTASE